MGPFEFIGRGIAKGLWSGAKAATYPFRSNWPGRIVGGGIAGGVYGGLTSDETTSTGQFRNALGGALAGAGIMAGARLAMEVPGAIWRSKGAIRRAAWGGAKRVAKTAWNYPLATGLAGVGLYAAMSGGGGGISARERGMIAEQYGVSSSGFSPGMGGTHVQETRQAFMASTEGLVQGLHQSRH